MSSAQLSKTDSEVSSLSQSSPTRSPRRAVYYVQSPSRDSHDGEKTTNSFHSTPVLSPMGSPPHSHSISNSNSSLGPHSSRESSSTRLSESLNRNRKATTTNDNNTERKSSRNPWKYHHHNNNKGFDAIEEEGLLDGETTHSGLHSRRCYFLTFVVGFVLLSSVFSLILWGASKPQKPTITLKSISFNQLVVQAGADFSGVATELVSMNCSVKFTFRNTATFFGVHVTSTPLDLSYSQLTVATGTIRKFYQSRKSQRSVTVMMKGSHIPLYGGGAGLNSLIGAPIEAAPLTLSFMVRSRAYVLGRLVKPKFYNRVECSVVMDPKKMNVAISMKNKCIYN